MLAGFKNVSEISTLQALYTNVHVYERSHYQTAGTCLVKVTFHLLISNILMALLSFPNL